MAPVKVTAAKARVQMMRRHLLADSARRVAISVGGREGGSEGKGGWDGVDGVDGLDGSGSGVLGPLSVDTGRQAGAPGARAWAAAGVRIARAITRDGFSGMVSETGGGAPRQSAA
jgi:hypothetical protein